MEAKCLNHETVNRLKNKYITTQNLTFDIGSLILLTHTNFLVLLLNENPKLYSHGNVLKVTNACTCPIYKACTVHYQSYKYVNSIHLPGIFGE